MTLKIDINRLRCVYAFCDAQEDCEKCRFRDAPDDDPCPPIMASVMIDVAMEKVVGKEPKRKKEAKGV